MNVCDRLEALELQKEALRPHSPMRDVARASKIQRKSKEKSLEINET